MSGERAAWITGLGLATPLGLGVAENWANFRAGVNGVRPIRNFTPEPDFPVQFAGEVPEAFAAAFDRDVRLPFSNRYARFTQLTLWCAQEALAGAGLDLAAADAGRIGVCRGVGGGSYHYLIPVDEALRRGARSYEEMADHNFVVKYMANAAMSQLSIWKGLRGPCATVAAACASGAMAIETALHWIRMGKADVVLTGGADSTVSRLVLYAYHKMGALAARADLGAAASRPFDRDRSGFVMAEAAAVLVLESEAHARRRGAPRIARLLGGASSSEANNIVAPRPAGVGMAETMRRALDDAQLAPEAVGYVSAHGTGTKLNDVAETAAVKAVFGARAARIPFSSQKSMMGHAIGATSAVEAAVTALGLRDGVVTPTIHLENPDPECDLDYVPGAARPLDFAYALSNAFGFGGHNTVLAFGR